jgi:hypothetical protein
MCDVSGIALLSYIRCLSCQDATHGTATQTNEPGRCAVLLPVLAGLSEPLALLEVGAFAGLCLLPDFYAYDFGRVN